MDKEKKRIIKILRSFPLSGDFVLNEGWWDVAYKALDEVADYLEAEDKNNEFKKKLSKK